MKTLTSYSMFTRHFSQLILENRKYVLINTFFLLPEKRDFFISVARNILHIFCCLWLCWFSQHVSLLLMIICVGKLWLLAFSGEYIFLKEHLSAYKILVSSWLFCQFACWVTSFIDYFFLGRWCMSLHG
jgi:hypothetical protein